MTTINIVITIRKHSNYGEMVSMANSAYTQATRQPIFKGGLDLGEAFRHPRFSGGL